MRIACTQRGMCVACASPTSAARICRPSPISPILILSARGPIIVMKMRPAQVLELVVNLVLPWVAYRLTQP
jgi:hypothetical protein